MQLQVRLEPQEIQFVVAAIHQTQILGKNAKMVADILDKFEKKIEDVVEVKQ
jgi:Asp-tRNA(Asn)/Glu-tRNA(Gln) amidotransferase B subunit